MPSLIGSLYVSLTADFAPFQRNMRQAEGVVASTSGGMRKSMGLTERSVSSLQRSMSTGVRPYALISAARTFDTVQQRANLLRGALFAATAAFGGLGAALTTNVVSRYLDSFTGLENQLRVVSDGSADLAANMSAVQAVAERSRASLAAVGTLYSRIAKSAPGEGSEKILRRVETINKALQLGGATAQESASAAIQFSQAIASNRLGGEELRAVLETPLGLELAKGIGVSIGKFREMGYAGELTADVLFKALDKISGTIDGQFAQSVSTIDQALTVADGKITAFAGSLDDAYGITKLLTSAIGGFGNNLESIVPVVALLAAGMGTIFAGRLSASVIGGRFTAVAAGIKSITQARRDDLRIASEQYAMAQRTKAAADIAVGKAAGAVKGDVASLAPKSVTNAVLREEATLAKLQQAQTKNVQDRIAVAEKLRAVTATMSTGAVRAAEDVLKAEKRVTDAMGKRWSIQSQLAKADKALANLPKAGVAPNWLFPADVDAKEREILQRRKKLAADLFAVDAGLARDRETLSKNTIRMTQLESDADRRAAAERLKYRQALNQLERQNQANQRGIFAQRAKIGAANTAVSAAGMMAGNEALSGAQRAANAASSSVIRAGEAMAFASRAAGKMAVGMNLAKTAGMSLVGFLGGWWGVVFTGAIAAITTWGVKSREAAMEVANAQAIIEERLGRLEGTEGLSAEKQATLLESRIKAESDQLGVVLLEMERTRGILADQIASLVNDPRINSLPNAEAVISTIRRIEEEYRSGAISVEEVGRQLRELPIAAQAIDAVIANLKENTLEADRAALAVDEIQKSLDALNGQQARVQINVDVNDPFGILSRGLSGSEAAKAQGSSYDAAERNRNNSMLRRGIDEKRQKEDKAILARARDDKGQEITDRELELFTDGMGRTREEARKLAEEEIRLKDATAAAGKSASSAAKDYENFGIKIAELEGQADAAWLSELDQKVVNFAKGLKDGSEMMRQYIEAIRSGDLSKAPEELLRVRDALMELGAAEAWEGIIQQYGTAAQLSEIFAQKQGELALMVQKGAITAEQAALVWADFMTSFGQYEWIDSIASAFGDFAHSAIFDFENIGEAAKRLLMQILEIIVQLLILKPLMDAIKVGLTGGGGGVAGLLLGSVNHDGTMSASQGRNMRPMSRAAFRGARRFHQGNLKGKEMAAILEEGEAVLTQNDMVRNVKLIGDMSNALKAGGGGMMEIIVSGARGNKEIEAMVQAGVMQGIAGYDKTARVRFVRDANRARSRGDI